MAQSTFGAAVAAPKQSSDAEQATPSRPPQEELRLSLPWHQKLAMRFWGKFDTVPCTYLDWYQFCIDRPKQGAVLCTVAGEGQFLDDPRGIEWANKEEELQAMEVWDGLKRLITVKGVRLAVVLDSNNPAANKTARRFAATIKPETKAGQTAKPAFVAFTSGVISNHFSIYREHVFIEAVHKPHALLENRPGVRVTNYKDAFQYALEEWNNCLLDESTALLTPRE